MKKKFLSLLAATALITPTWSFAIGLGSVRTYSHLNERLNAEVPVLSVKKKGRITATLASNKEFAKRGIQRSDTLNNLRFSVVKRGGRSYVRISSAKQIAVPYLNFILQINSPEGIVSREYAIFLDPKNVGKKKRSTTSSQLASPYRKQQKSPATSKNVPKKKLATAKRSMRIKIANKRGGRYGPVRAGETLWSIAQNTRPSSRVAVSDMVEAIRRANPKVLATTLPAGVILNIPTIQGHSSYKKKSPTNTNSHIPKTNIVQSRLETTPPTVQKESRLTSEENSNQPIEKNKNLLNKDIPLVQSNIDQSTANINSPIESAEDDLTQAKSMAENFLLNAEKELNEQEQVTEIKNITADDEQSSVFDTPPDAPEAIGMISEEEVTDEITTEKPTQADSDETATVNNEENSMVSSTETMPENTEKRAASTQQTAAPQPKEISPIETVIESGDDTLAQNKSLEITGSETSVESKNEPQVNSTKSQTVTVEAKALPTSTNSAPSALSTNDDLITQIKNNAPTVGIAAAALGIGGLLLVNRRRKAKEAALPSAAATTDVSTANHDAETTDEDILSQLIQNADNNQPTQDSISEHKTHHVASDTLEDSTNIDFSHELDIEDTSSKIDNIDTVTDLTNSNSNIDFSLENETSPEQIAEIQEELDTLVSDTAVGDISEGLDFNFINDETDSTFDIDKAVSLTEDVQPDEANDTSSSFDVTDDSSEEVLIDDLSFDLTDGDSSDLSNEELLSLIDDLPSDSREDTSTSDKDVTQIPNEIQDNDEILNFDFSDNDNIIELDSDDNNLFSHTDDLKDSIDKANDYLSASESVDTSEIQKDETSNQSTDKSEGITLDFNSSNIEDTFAIGDNETVQTAFEQHSTQTARESLSKEVKSRMQMKLDLANSFISISESTRASVLLKEIIQGGSEEQAKAAQKLLDTLDV